MISLTLSPHYSSALPSLEKPQTLPSNLGPLHHTCRFLNKRNVVKRGVCRAELSQDAPFAIAIGASILSSAVLATPPSDEEDADTVMDSTDARLAVMGIISFIPYFNWLSWVFAWIDTGKRRYAVYSLVYLIPYLRSNLSLSPEESWLPIASIVFCIIHVQLEASIRNGDLQSFQLFGKAEKNISSLTKEKDDHLEEQQDTFNERRKEQNNLPQAGKHSRNEISGWGAPEKPLKHPEHEEADDDRRRKY